MGRAKKSAMVTADWIYARALEGIGPLSSAYELAKEYAGDKTYKDDDARVRALIKKQTAWNFGIGFLTGLGGLVTLPIAVPAALSASWLLLARMTIAIAILYGRDPREDQVKMLVLLSIVGGGAMKAPKDAGIQMGLKFTENAIQQLSGKALIEINKKVGFRLITKAGETGVVNLTKVIPVVGAVVAGGIDAAYARLVARAAVRLLKPPPAPTPRGDRGAPVSPWLPANEPEDTARLADRIYDRARDAIGPLSSPASLAREYELDESYPDTDARVRALIRWETRKNLRTGFLNGIGRLVTLPIAAPAASGASWLILARMAATIAVLYGHDLREDRVKTLVVLSLAGGGVKDVLKDAGIEVGGKLTKEAMDRIPDEALVEINRRIGFRLVAGVDGNGVEKLARVVPVVGGLIAGRFDAAHGRAVGRMAVKLLKPPAA